MMYSDPRLFVASFALLLRSFSARCALRNQLVRTELLVSKRFSDWAGELDNHLSRLHHMVSSFTQWGMANYPHLAEAEQIRIREAKEKEVSDILQELASACSSLEPVLDPVRVPELKPAERELAVERTPAQKYQLLCRSKGAHIAVLALLRVAHRRVQHVAKDKMGMARRQRIEEHNDLLERLHKQCFVFLEAFVMGSPPNQRLISAELPAFCAQLCRDDSLQRSSNRQLLQALSALFAGNSTLASNVPPDLIAFVSSSVETALSATSGGAYGTRSGGLMHAASVLLPFLKHICVPNEGIAMNRNQHAALNVLAKPGPTSERLFVGQSAQVQELTTAFVKYRDSVCSTEGRLKWGGDEETPGPQVNPALQAKSALQAALELHIDSHEFGQLKAEDEEVVSAEVLCHMATLYTHVKLVELLAVVNHGGLITVQARSQALFPLPALVAALTQPEQGYALPSLTAALCQLFLHCYIRSKLVERGALLKSALRPVLTALAQRIDEAAAAQTAGGSAVGSASDFAQCVMHSIMPMLHAYFTDVMDDRRQYYFRHVRKALLLSAKNFQEATALSVDDSATLTHMIQEIETGEKTLQLKHDKALCRSVRLMAGLGVGAPAQTSHQTHRLSKAKAVLDAVKRKTRSLYAGGANKPVHARSPSLRKELTPISSADEEPAAETVTATAMERRREVVARVRFSRLVSIVRASATIQEDVAKEFDRLMRMVKQVEAMTDPHDPDYLASDELKTRTASVTLPMLCGRMASHVQAHLRSKSAQGCWVNSACFLLFRRLLEDEMDRPDLWAVGIDELLLPPLGPTAPGLGGSLVLHRAYGDATVALAITEAAHEDNDAEALASRREETQDTAIVRYCRKAGHACSFVTSRVAAVVLWALRLIAPPMSLAEFHAACGRTLRRLNSWYWLLTSK
jgi:hypothetical protein